MIINLTSPVNNASIQIGDDAYFIATQTTDGSDQLAGNNPQKIGQILAIGPSFITVAENTDLPANAFIMFLKNNTANSGSLKGYFAEVNMKHSGTKPAELFAVSSEVTESSK